MTFISGESGRSFDMGRVITGTFAAVSANFFNFCAGAIVLLGVPQALSVYAALVRAAEPDGSGVLVWVAVLLNLIGSSIMSGYIVYTVVAGYRGQVVTIGESYAAAIRSILGLFGASILISLGLVLGFLLFLVPGIIFMIMWCVTVPALVVEGLSPVAAMKRSQELTKGARWPIFWLAAVGILINLVLTFAASGFNLGTLSGGNPTLSALTLQAIVSIFASIIFGSGGAIIYSELRSVKEGIGAEQLASVFD